VRGKRKSKVSPDTLPKKAASRARARAVRRTVCSALELKDLDMPWVG